MKNTFALILLSIIFASCEKVIELDLDKGASQMVIEGELFNQEGNNYVKLSRSKGFYDDNNFESVENATVEIADDTGNTWLLDELDPGYYNNPSLTGISGRTYTLNIDAGNGEIYTASSTMPVAVPIDSLFLFSLAGNPFIDVDGYTVQTHYSDPVDVDNFYRFKVLKDGESIPTIDIVDDRFTDGKSTFYAFFREIFESGQTVSVEMQTVDQTIYNYFNALADNEGQGPSSTIPANPKSNINQASIGYFSAATVSKVEIVVP